MLSPLMFDGQVGRWAGGQLQLGTSRLLFSNSSSKHFNFSGENYDKNILFSWPAVVAQWYKTHPTI